MTYRLLCLSALFSFACAPYMAPVPANPLGDANAIRLEIVPVNESNPNGPLRMVLRKKIDRGWITLGDICETRADGTTTSCPANGTPHLTYVTRGNYKIRAEYIGPTGSTAWGSVIEAIAPGYVYTCQVTGENTEGCRRVPIAEASAAAPAPPTLAPAPEPTAPTAPGPSPAPTIVPAPAAGGCAKDVDCPGDFICRGGACVSPTGAAPPPAVQIVPEPAPAPTPPPAVIIEKNPACDTCEAKCAAHKSACNAGTISECFEAGACVCECKLDAGGCGDDRTQLTECVAKNRAKAKPKKPVN